MSQPEWCTIESDPGVFTELIESFGVEGVQVEELYDLSQVHDLNPVFGLIFLFKWQKEHYEMDDSVILDHSEGLFFAKQVVQNACATQAIVSILLNCPAIKIGQELRNFKEFAIELPSDMRGLALANSQVIREAHNSFGRQESLDLSDFKNDDKGDNDAFHFISYIPFQGKLYELDGLKPGPIAINDVTDSNWLEKAIPVIQERIQKYSETEIRFNLMAVIGNREEVLKQRLNEMESRRKEALARLNGTGTLSGRERFDLPQGKNELNVSVSAMNAEIDMMKETLESERLKVAQWKIENQRRKHNYIPFVFHLLHKLAEKQKLQNLIDRARAKQQERMSAQSKTLKKT